MILALMSNNGGRRACRVLRTHRLVMRIYKATEGTSTGAHGGMHVKKYTASSLGFAFWSQKTGSPEKQDPHYSSIFSFLEVTQHFSLSQPHVV